MSDSCFVTYSGCVFRYAIDKETFRDHDKSSLQLQQICTTYCSDENTLKSSACTLQLPIIAQSDVILYACKSVISSETYLRKCCFIFGNRRQQYLFLCQVQNKNVKAHAKITLSFAEKSIPISQTQSQSRNRPKRPFSCYLLDGPSVAIVRDNMLYYAGMHDRTLCQLGCLIQNGNASSIVTVLLCSRVCDFILIIARQDITEDNIFSFETDKKAKTNATNSIIVASLFNCSSGDSSNSSANEQLDSTTFIPAPYASIVLCIKVQNQINCLENVTERDIIAQQLTASTVFVCTSYSQLLAFSKGRLLHCLPLPFEDTKNIFLLKNGAGNEYVIVHSPGGTVCVIQQSNFQILRTFHGIGHVFVEDFIHCGADQLLLVADCDVNGGIEQFCLTDFHTHHIDKLQQVPADTGKIPESTNNLQSVITALGSRLQVGLASKDQVCRKNRLKSDLISQSCRRIRQLSLHKEFDDIRSKPYLQSLFSQPTSHVPHSSWLVKPHDLTESLSEVLSVQRTWHRVIEDHLVMGVHVVNTSDSPLYRPQLTAFTLDISTDCQHTWHQQCWLTDDSVTDRLTDQVTPGMAVTLSTCCKMPLFTASPCQRLVLLVSWQCEVKQRLADEPQRSLSTSVCCGHIGISVQQILRGGLDVQWKRLAGDDIIAVDTYQRQYYLRLLSSLSETSCLSETLGSKLGFELQALHSACDGCHVCHNTGPLHMCRVCVKCVSEHELRFVVHCRNEVQLFLLLHALYDKLPDDVIILPTNEMSRNLVPLTTRTLQALQSEVMFATQGLRNLLMKSKTEMACSANTSIPQSVQREVEQMREQHLAADRTACDPALFSSFKKTLGDLQKTTDHAVASLCRAVDENG